MVFSLTEIALDRVKVKRVTIILILAVAITACTPIGLIEPQKRTIAKLYTVQPQISWSLVTKGGKTEVWTVDGPALQQIRFVKGIPDGERLFKVRNGDRLPAYKDPMNAHEIMEFIVDSLTAIGMIRVHATGLRPASFGSEPGFRFDLTFRSRGGLEMEGFVLGMVMQERLHLILYWGASRHYYPKHRDDVEQIIDSIEML